MARAGIPWLLPVLVGPFGVLVAAFHAWRTAERLMTDVTLERERLEQIADRAVHVSRLIDDLLITTHGGTGSSRTLPPDAALR